MKFLKDTIQSFKWYEVALWMGSVVAVILSFALSPERDILTLIASILGATSLIFVAKGNVIGQFLGVAFAVFYGIISFYFHYYGEMITYLCMTAPISVASIVTWLRNSAKGRAAEVKVNAIRWKECVFLGFLSVAVTVAFYFILKAFGTQNLLFSTISVLTSFVACYLAMRRSRFYAIAYAANDVVLIVLWVLATIETLSYLPMIVCFGIFLLNDVYGFLHWTFMERRQKTQS